MYGAPGRQEGDVVIKGGSSWEHCYKRGGNTELGVWCEGRCCVAAGCSGRVDLVGCALFWCGLGDNQRLAPGVVENSADVLLAIAIIA